MKKQVITACLIFLFIAIQGFSQKKTEEFQLMGITGDAIGGEQLSPEQVKQKAINNAKINALKKAGIEENINSYTDYFRKESDNTFEELFTSDILSNIEGTVKDIEVVDTRPSFTAENQIKYVVTINCTVVKYNVTKDLSFDAWIEGIQPFYQSGSGLTFSIKPTIPCYARVFAFTDEPYPIYPNEWEKSKLLPALEITNFPDLDKINSYEVSAEKKDKETHRLIIVLLKNDLYYTGKVGYKEIIDWIMTIPPDERKLETFTFEVFKKK